MSYNNIIKGDGDSIISLNYLYNPRNYFKQTIPKKDVLNKLQQTIPLVNAVNKVLL